MDGSPRTGRQALGEGVSRRKAHHRFLPPPAGGVSRRDEGGEHRCPSPLRSLRERSLVQSISQIDFGKLTPRKQGRKPIPSLPRRRPGPRALKRRAPRSLGPGLRREREGEAVRPSRLLLAQKHLRMREGGATHNPHPEEREARLEGPSEEAPRSRQASQGEQPPAASARTDRADARKDKKEPHHPLHLASRLSQQAEGVKADRARPVAAKRAKRLDALGFPLRKTRHGVKGGEIACSHASLQYVFCSLFLMVAFESGFAAPLATS